MSKRVPYSNRKYRDVCQMLCTTKIKFFYTNGAGYLISPYVCDFCDKKFEEVKEDLYERGVYMISTHIYNGVPYFEVYLWNTDIEYKRKPGW